jgi:hypothetical protein
LIDIPLNKALVAVERRTEDGVFFRCEVDCYFSNAVCCNCVICTGNERKDGKNVIFKLVDLP